MMDLNEYRFAIERDREAAKVRALQTREERIAYVCKYPFSSDEERKTWLEAGSKTDHGGYVTHTDHLGDSWITCGDSGSCLFYSYERLQNHITWIETGIWNGGQK